MKLKISFIQKKFFFKINQPTYQDFFSAVAFLARSRASRTFLSCDSRRLKYSVLSSYGRGPRIFLHSKFLDACTYLFMKEARSKFLRGENVIVKNK